MHYEDEEEIEEGHEEDFSEFVEEEKDDQAVLDDLRNKAKQSKQGFRSLVSRKRMSKWDMDEVFLM